MVNSRTRLLFSLFFPPRHPSGFRFRLPPCDRLLPVILTTPPVIDRPRLKKGREKSKRKVVSRRESRIFGVENNRRSFLRQSNGFPVLAFVKRVVQTYLRSLSLSLRGKVAARHLFRAERDGRIHQDQLHAFPSLIAVVKHFTTIFLGTDFLLRKEAHRRKLSFSLSVCRTISPEIRRGLSPFRRWKYGCHVEMTLFLDS